MDTIDPRTSVPVASEDICALVRDDVVQMCAGPEGGHIGGALSCVEALVALYFSHLNVDPDTPRHPDRDILILSKGHAALAHYATLARRGFFDPALLTDYCRAGSRLSPHANPAVAGVEAATGSLGHGLALGVGFALARRGREPRPLVHVLVGDGELQEGSCWEAIQLAARQGLGNLVVLVDANDGQQTGRLADISDLEPMVTKWQAFGWNVGEVGDGNNLSAITSALAQLRAEGQSDRPVVLILRTVKANGTPLLAGKPASHFVALTPRRLAQVRSSMDRPTELVEGAAYGEHT